MITLAQAARSLPVYKKALLYFTGRPARQTYFFIWLCSAFAAPPLWQNPLHAQSPVELTFATPEYIDETYRQALDSFYLQDYETSLNYIRHVIRADMTNYNLRYLAAHNHWKLGNLDSAEAHFQAAISSTPNEPGAYIDFTLLLIHRRKYVSARRVAANGAEAIEKSGAKVPSKMYNVLARACLLSGDGADALEYAEMAKGALDQNDTGIKDKMEAMVIEARVHLAMENFEKAELSLLWALSLKENNPYAQNLLGVVYLKWAEKSEAEKGEELRQNAREIFQAALVSSETLEEFKPVILINQAGL